MKIQTIGLSEENKLNIHKNNYSRINYPESLDVYDLNIIDMSSENVWRTSSHVTNFLDIDEDLTNLKLMIENSNNTKILVLLPQNINFFYDSYYRRIEIKRMLNDFQNHLKKIIDLPFRDIIFEPNSTKVGKQKIKSDFYFLPNQGLSPSKELTNSIGSEKMTTICNSKENIIFTSLNMNEIEDIYIFLEEIGLMRSTLEIEPEWMKDVKILDDENQIETIRLSEERIRNEQILINDSKKKLEKNNRYKSILYTQSDDLVEVVFEMMEEMLGIDLSEFVDDRKEDIGFKINGEYFIGEIKGINSNVKSTNLSQLDLHLNNFVEKTNGIQEENVRRLLIINHQRSKSLADRDPIDIKQVNFAETKYKSLIIETETLLKLFEKFRTEEISREEVIEMFRRVGR
ncbi:MAG: hypothetical protein ACRCXQ_05130, partial [Vagococcus fluvialis]